uniref:Protein KRI1 homolog n=2 Tax=Eptatretus burgeri TaxID=7764 RepID=A0A8C4N513_EPTBU
MASSSFRVNQAFAKNYHRYRREEELQRLRDRYGDAKDSESGSDSDSESECEEVISPKREREFYRTLSLLKKNDPKIYQKDAKFYSSSSSDDEGKQNSKKKKDSPFFIADYERNVMLVKNGKYVDESDEENELKDHVLSHVEEQKQIKESFQAFLAESNSESESEAKRKGDQDLSTVLGSGLLQHKKKTQKEKEGEEADFRAWLRGQGSSGGGADLAYLRDRWCSSQLPEDEIFLRDYLLLQRYQEKKEDKEEDAGSDEDKGGHVLLESQEGEEEEDSDEEGFLFLKKQDDFERKMNFRFVEPDNCTIRSFARNAVGSVRTKDKRRQQKRETKKERKRQEKELRFAELRHLERLQQEVAAEKLQKLWDAAHGWSECRAQVKGDGNDLEQKPEGMESEEVGNLFQTKELDGDFDPTMHDQMMAKYFGDEYYQQVESKKPDMNGWCDDGDLPCEDGTTDETKDWNEPHCDDSNFVMDVDFDPTAKRPPQRKTRGVKKKTSAIDRLPCEDVLDDLTCRFKYRKVIPNDFGLTPEEIIFADDRELNQWSSLRKTCMYRTEAEELKEVHRAIRRGANIVKKRNVLQSLVEREENMEFGQPKKTAPGFKQRVRLRRKEQLTALEEEQAVGLMGREVEDNDDGSEDRGEANEDMQKNVKGKAKPSKLPKFEVNTVNKRVKADGGRQQVSVKHQLEITEGEKGKRRDKKKHVEHERKRKPQKAWVKGKRKREPESHRCAELSLQVGDRTMSASRIAAYGLNVHSVFRRHKQSKNGSGLQEKQK